MSGLGEMSGWSEGEMSGWSEGEMSQGTGCTTSI